MPYFSKGIIVHGSIHRGPFCDGVFCLLAKDLQAANDAMYEVANFWTYASLTVATLGPFDTHKQASGVKIRLGHQKPITCANPMILPFRR